MPQTSIIRSDGTGDYTSIQAWVSAEQLNDYGPGVQAIGRLDGFFDTGIASTDLGGNWVNGARLEAFDESIAFDGTRRQLCGLTSADTGISLRNRGSDIELYGLEIYNTSTGTCYYNTTTGGYFKAENCLFKDFAPSNSVALFPAYGTGPGFVNCVIDSSDRAFYPAPGIEFSGCSIFANTSSSVGTTSSTNTSTDCVVVNAQSPAGTCYRSSVIQTNCAGTDGTADDYPNIAVSNEFINADPVGSGDYRVNGDGVIGTAGIGAFIETAGTTFTFNAETFSVTLSFGQVGMTVEEVSQIDPSQISTSFAVNQVNSEFSQSIITSKFKG